MNTTTPAAPPPAPLPTLTPADTDLLNAFLNANLSLPALASNTGQTLAHVMTWRARPHIDAYITLYLKFKAQADEQADRADHAAAMSTLRALLTATNPVEQRRAATTMLRALAQQSRPKPREKPIDKRIDASHDVPHDKPRVSAAAPRAHPSTPTTAAHGVPITYNPLREPLAAAAQPAPASSPSKRPNPAALIAAALAPTG